MLGLIEGLEKRRLFSGWIDFNETAQNSYVSASWDSLLQPVSLATGTAQIEVGVSSVADPAFVVTAAVSSTSPSMNVSGRVYLQSLGAPTHLGEAFVNLNSSYSGPVVRFSVTALLSGSGSFRETDAGISESVTQGVNAFSYIRDLHDVDMNGNTHIAIGSSQSSWEMEMSQLAVYSYYVPVSLAEPGDINEDGTVDIADVEFQSNLTYAQDLNGDGLVNSTDRTYLVQTILGTKFGDVDLSGTVDSDDIRIIQSNIGKPGLWWQGDTDGDRDVDSTDLAIARANLPTVTITATDGAAAEAGSNTGTFTITRTGSTARALSIDFTRGGSTATNGVDYSSILDNVVIPVGQASVTVTITPIDDVAVEGNESVIVTLANSDGYNLGAASSATVVINDNDSAALNGEIVALEDTYVHDGNPASNYGSSTSIQSKFSSSSGFTRQAFLKFDLSGVSSTISSAKIRVFGTLNTAGSINIVARSTGTSWSEGTMVWSNKPAIGSTNLDSITVNSTSAQWYELDVTTYVQQQRGLGNNTVSFALVGTADSTPYLSFNSSENGTNKARLAYTSQPATTSVIATADTYVHDGNPTTTYGTQTKLESKRFSGSGFTREAFLKFDLTGASSISSAKIRLYGKLNTADTLALAIRSVSNTAWSETGVTWASGKPSYASSNLATATVTHTTDQWTELDVTAYVQQQKSLGNNVVSFALIGTTSTSAVYAFNSREAASNKAQMQLA